jgi:hypothetical protein
MSVVALLCFGLALGQSVSAQSARGLLAARGNSSQSASTPSPNSNCKLLKGTEVDLYDPIANLNTGTITNGGFLNGPTLWTYPTPGFVFTPDPNVVAFLSDVKVTTVHGELKAHLVITCNFVTTFCSNWGSIDPGASTGSFAGATGAISFDQYVQSPDFSVGPYTNSIGGQICFAQ